MRSVPHRGVVEAPLSPRSGSAATCVLRFAHDTRGAAGLELAIGACVVFGLAVLCFAAYARIEAVTSAPRIAFVVAEFVSRETAPDAAQLDALADFLREHELGAGHAVLVVTTAVRKEAGADPAVLWIDRIRLGDETATGELAANCEGRGADGGDAALGEHFAMDDGETVFVVDVCVRPPASAISALWPGDLHYHFLMPTREPDAIPERPMRAPS